MATTPKQRVVVTGMGTINPLGNSVESLWDGMKQGKSGIGYLTQIKPEEQTCRIGGECWDFDPAQYIDKKEARRMDRFTQFALAATQEAYRDANLNGSMEPERLGVVIGCGVGGISTIHEQLQLCMDKGFNRCSPFLVPMIISDMAGGRISIEYNAKGPNISVVTACASGSDALGEAFRMIQNGEVDVVIAGGTEAPITPLAIAGFSTSRALSAREEEPSKASRPFDQDRDGFVIAEGAGILILENLDHAQKRNAKIYAEMTGYGRSSDANDIVAPCPDGAGAARAMRLALKDANLQPSDIGYINAHGTSTPLGDVAETSAIKEVYQDHAKNGLLVSSTKSMHGHMLGATGAVEAIISVKALQEKLVPPTINIDTPDPSCDLDYVADTARPVPTLNAVASNSFGFGGHNASLVFQAYDTASA